MVFGKVKGTSMQAQPFLTFIEGNIAFLKLYLMPYGQFEKLICYITGCLPFLLPEKIEKSIFLALTLQINLSRQRRTTQHIILSSIQFSRSPLWSTWTFSVSPIPHLKTMLNQWAMSLSFSHRLYTRRDRCSMHLRTHSITIASNSYCITSTEESRFNRPTASKTSSKSSCQ